MFLLIGHKLFYIFGTKKYKTITDFLNCKCLKCVPHTQIIGTVSFGIQIQQIYKDKLSSHQYESPLDPILTK